MPSQDTAGQKDKILSILLTSFTHGAPQSAAGAGKGAPGVSRDLEVTAAGRESEGSPGLLSHGSCVLSSLVTFSF